MNDISGQSYISTILLPGSDVTHYVKDSEARNAITAVETGKQEKITANGLLKGDGSGGVSAAVSGTDYLAPMQTTSSPSAVGNSVSFIDTISQNAQGVITATKKTIPTASSSVAGITTVGASGGADAYGAAAEAERVAKAYADDLVSALGSYMTLRGTRSSESAIKAIDSAEPGDVYINTADNSEWVCTQSIETATAAAWEKLGYNMDLSIFEETSNLGALAYADTASGSFQPAGSITVNAYTPEGTITSHDNGTANYTPAGTVSTPTITVVPTTTTVNSITAVGSLPSWSASVANETLTFDFSPGTLPTKGSNTTVATGIQSATSTQPSFTGTAIELRFTGTAKAPTGSFSGTSGTVIVAPAA